MILLENFLKNKRVQKTLNTKPGEEGFSLVELVVVIAVLAILSAVAIPAFVGVQANARASAVKNGLVNGVKECVVRKADFKSTEFLDAASFKNPDAFNGYTMGQIEEGEDGNTCYAATATADESTDSNFTIEMNPSTGDVERTCTNVNASGCSGLARNILDEDTGEIVGVDYSGSW